MPNQHLQDLKTAVQALLATRMPTPEEIRELVKVHRRIHPQVTDDEAEALAAELEHIHDVRMDLGASLEEAGFEKWLEGAKKDIDFYYWSRYRLLLASKNFSGQVLAPLDSVTDRILGLLENPKKDGRWDRRGMVVGHVQSGKTANYVGLVAKAADAGYKVIIIIAGLHNNLRNQTQARVDEGFIGVDSARIQAAQHPNVNLVGVGKHDSRRRPSTFTTTLQDFNRQTATALGLPLRNLSEPAVFVVKKNARTLQNLIEWLQEHNARHGTSSISEPMLLIDDEADNASINIKHGAEEVSRINGQIRQLLGLFYRSGYVGYTATPFANIFIDPESDDEMYGADLFPRDFIVSLDPPGNYFGADQVFLQASEESGETPVVRHIEDNEDLLPMKHQITHRVAGLPESLEDAVRAFIVGRAIRLARGHQREHNSMLVNVSRFVAV